MRISLISSHFPPAESPESAHTMFLCEKLAEKGHRVSLITSRLLAGAPLPRGYTIYPVMKNWGWGELPVLLKTILYTRPDAALLIYIDWIYGCKPMVTFLPSIIKIFNKRIKFVTQFENISGLTDLKAPNGLLDRVFFKLARLIFYRSLSKPVYGTLLKDSDKIIALSERHADVFISTESNCTKKIKVIPAPPIMKVACSSAENSARIRGRNILKINAQQIVISYFGYLYWMKGLETFLESLKYVSRDVRVLIIGGTSDHAYLEKLKDLCRLEGVSDMISWLGYCVDELASIYLYASDICVLPFNDGVRLNNSSFAVAASHGLPIVTTQGDNQEDPFINNENVKLCLPQSPELLGAAINELITDPELRQKLAIGSKKLADTYFSWDRVIDSTLECLFSENKCKPAR